MGFEDKEKINVLDVWGQRVLGAEQLKPLTEEVGQIWRGQVVDGLEGTQVGF